MLWQPVSVILPHSLLSPPVLSLWTEHLNGNIYWVTDQLSDEVEVRKERVDIDEQGAIPTEDANITGGYFLEVDGWATAEPVYYKTNRSVLVTVNSPHEEVIVSRQLEYNQEPHAIVRRCLVFFAFCGIRQGISSLCGFLDNWPVGIFRQS